MQRGEIYRLEACPRIALETLAAPSPAVAARVDRIWDEATQDLSRFLFDGTQLCLVPEQGLPGEGVLRGGFVPYRRFFAQLNDPELVSHLRLRALGVTGVLWCAEGLLLSQRAPSLAFWGGMWEALPRGGVSRDAQDSAGAIDLQGMLFQELEEETGLGRERVVDLRATFLYWNPRHQSLDVVFEGRVDARERDVRAVFAAHTGVETQAIRAVAREDLPAFMAAHPMTADAQAILGEVLRD